MDDRGNQRTVLRVTGDTRGSRVLAGSAHLASIGLWAREPAAEGRLFRRSLAAQREFSGLYRRFAIFAVEPKPLAREPSAIEMSVCVKSAAPPPQSCSDRYFRIGDNPNLTWQQRSRCRGDDGISAAIWRMVKQSSRCAASDRSTTVPAFSPTLFTIIAAAATGPVALLRWRSWVTAVPEKARAMEISEAAVIKFGWTEICLPFKSPAESGRKMPAPTAHRCPTLRRCAFNSRASGSETSQGSWLPPISTSTVSARSGTEMSRSAERPSAWCHL